MDILDTIERADAEEIAAVIIGSEDTEVTDEQMEQWSDYDLLIWLVEWGNKWAEEIADAHGLLGPGLDPAAQMAAAGAPTLFDELEAAS